MSILDRLPSLVQNDRARDQIRVQYDSDIDVYTLPKAPVEEVHGVHDDEQTYLRGTDYEILVDDDNNPVEIDWDTGGETPDHGTDFIVDSTFETIIKRYSFTHDQEFGKLDASIDSVRDSRQIDNASGDDLDEIGAIFGPLGRRRGRSDQDYRVYLKSVVQSFNGRGSVQGLRFAIASAIGTDPSNIEIIERFDELEYDIQIFNVDTSFISSSINDLADLADPSVVQLGEAIIVFDQGGILIGGDPSTRIEQTTGLGGGTLTLDGQSQLG